MSPNTLWTYLDAYYQGKFNTAIIAYPHNADVNLCRSVPRPNPEATYFNNTLKRSRLYR